MAHYGTLKDVRFATEDIRGAHLYGLNDEKLGKIDDVIFDHSTGNIRYVVVDTGGWLSSKKFLVPAEGLRASTKHETTSRPISISGKSKVFRPTTNPTLSPKVNGQATKDAIVRSG